jgi:hypothetical protein
MTDSFPCVSTVSLRDADPGSIIRISRHDGSKLALVTDQIVDDVRSFVWLTPNFQDKETVIFAEKWRNDPSVLQYSSAVRFELGTTDAELDPIGRNSWETAGVIVSIGDSLLIRAAPMDSFYGGYKLVNIRNGAVYSDRPPETLWTYLSWRLWIRDPSKRCDVKLTEFNAANH